MKITKIHASNFCLFESIEFDLYGQGLVWIGGENKDSDSATSNGSGKSTLFKAIVWGLYGESIDGNSGDEVIRNGATAACVTLFLEISNERWIVSRTRRKGQPRLSLIREGDKEPWSGSRQLLQSKIESMIGLDFKAFSNTVYYGQGDRKRFVDRSTSDAERKSICSSIIGTEIISTCREIVRKNALKFKRETEALNLSLAELRGSIEENNSNEIEKQFDEWERDRQKKVAKLADLAKSYVEKARSSSQRDKLAQAKSKLNSLPLLNSSLAKNNREIESDRLKKLTEESDQLSLERKSICMSINVVRDQVDAFHGKSECPLCRTPVESDSVRTHIESLEKELTSLEDQREAICKSELIWKSKILKQKEILSKAKDHEEQQIAIAGERLKINSEIEKLSFEINRAGEYASEAKRIATEALELRDSENPHLKILRSSKEKLKACTRRVRELKKERSSVSKALAHYQFWVKGFSNQGLPSFLLDSVMPYITERTNYYLEILTDGDITMSFSSQLELKSSKELRDKIGITWEIEGVSDYAPSGGQLKKMEIATDLALMDLVAVKEGNHPDILLLDEVLDGLDEEGRNRVSKLLHELRKTKSSIFVISHDDSICESFEKSLLVTKNNGVSCLEKK